MRILVDREPEVGVEVGRGREAYGTFGGDGANRWRKTFVPGPSGLDDAPQVVVEVYQPGPYSGTTSTYTYVTDEMGTTLAIVAEDEGGTATEPPVPVRYLYTPYGQAHAETGPELLRARFDAQATSVDSGTGGAVTQVVQDTKEATPGALVLTWSSPIAPASLETGLVVERLAAGEGWVAVPPEQIAIGTTPSADPLTDTSAELRVLRLAGWQEATNYRVRLTPTLEDRLRRPFGRSETLQWTVPAAPSEEDDVPPPQYEQRYPRRYESYEAAGATAGGRFPGGQSRLFQGLWTDSVTGMSYARARWLDTRTGAWLSEDPLGAVDSVNLYAFVGWQPPMGVDPLGLQGREDCSFGMSEAAASICRRQMVQPADVGELLAHPYTQGTMQVVFGCAEAAGGLVVTVGSGGAGVVPGAVLFVHGGDLCQTGFKTLFTGEVQETEIKKALRGVCSSTGLDTQAAEFCANMADATIVAVSGVGAGRAVFSSSAAFSARTLGPDEILALGKGPLRAEVAAQEGAAVARGTTAGARRATRFGANWQGASLDETVGRIAGPNPMVETTASGKQIFRNPDTGLQVVYDTTGNYFRIENPAAQGVGRYLDLYGGEIPANVPLIGPQGTTQMGVPRDVRNALTHFLNVD